MSVFTNPSSRSLEHAKAYVSAVLELLGRRDPLEVLRGTEAALRQAIEGVPARQLGEPEAAGKWSIRQVMAHLADSELVWGYRLRSILAQDRPTLTGYDQDLWSDRLHYADVDAASALKQFGVLRESNLRLFQRATPDDMKRVGIHAERGEESVEHMIKLYAGHDLLHLAQIQRIRKSLAKSK